MPSPRPARFRCSHGPSRSAATDTSTAVCTLATNADGLAGRDLDLVIVLSPMGHTSSDASRSPSRRVAHRRLQREVRTLRDHGVEVQVISPDTATVKTMGWNMLERGNTASVMRAAFLGTAQQLRPGSDLRAGRARRSRNRLTSTISPRTDSATPGADTAMRCARVRQFHEPDHLVSSVLCPGCRVAVVCDQWSNRRGLSWLAR